MKVLLTGATGYIAQRLLPVLLENGHEVICCVRDKNRYHHNLEKYATFRISVIEVNFLEKSTLANIPADIDIAYYLVHSMSTAGADFEKLEQISAENFKERISQTKKGSVKQRHNRLYT